MTERVRTETMRTAERDLRQTFRGPVHVPGDAGYDRERATWSGALDQRPALVAEATSAADVRTAILVAREHGLLTLAVQSTGHGTQVPCDGGLLLKTGGLGGVLVDPQRRVARVGAGVTWGEVTAAAAPFGLVAAAGSTPSVGVAGFTLGGGHGWLSRRVGFAADNLLGAEVVTADGRILRVDAHRHPDLFWALRGGGGSFAVVTSLELRLHALPKVITAEVTFPRERAEQVLAAYRDSAPERPDTLTVHAVLRPDAVVLRAMHGAEDEDARAALAPLLRAAGAPLTQTYRACRFADAALGATAPKHFELLTDLPLDGLLEASEAATVEVRTWGGAMAAPEGEDPGPVGHRHVPFSVTIDGGPDALAPLRAHVTGGTFLNFLHDQTRTEQAWTPRDLRRLRAVKRAWDPANVLGLTHNLAPASTGAREAA